MENARKVGMSCVHSYSISDITDDIEALVREGHDEEMAMLVTVNLARGAYKKAHPEKSLPEHLQPKACRASIDAEVGKRKKAKLDKEEKEKPDDGKSKNPK